MQYEEKVMRTNHREIMKRWAYATLCIAILMGWCTQGKAQCTPDWSSLRRHSTPEWLDGTKFGIYCHCPQNGPIFTRKSIQPTYNQKARYLPISQKYLSHKFLNNSVLQKSQNLATDSMAGAHPLQKDALKELRQQGY